MPRARLFGGRPRSAGRRDGDARFPSGRGFRATLVRPRSLCSDTYMNACVAVQVAFLACVLPGVAVAQSSAPRQLRVIWAEDPAHHAIVSWSTDGAGQVHEVYYDTSPRNGVLSSYLFQSPSALNGSYNGGGLNYHHAEISGLTPSTTYYFVVVSDGQASPERHFVTGPEDDRPFKLLYGGDSRSNRSSRQDMNRRMAELLQSDATIMALWHGGDFIATGSNLGQWSAWLDDHELTVTSAGRVLPVIPARGNHEGDGALYNVVMAWPGGREVDYFVTRVGLNTTLITLDSNGAQGGAQREWLDRSLQEAQVGRWILANYHRPAYPAVKSPGGALQHWVPLFEQHNVDLVCESDGHALKRNRSHPERYRRSDRHRIRRGGRPGGLAAIAEYQSLVSSGLRDGAERPPRAGALLHAPESHVSGHPHGRVGGRRVRGDASSHRRDASAPAPGAEPSGPESPGPEPSGAEPSGVQSTVSSAAGGGSTDRGQLSVGDRFFGDGLLAPGRRRVGLCGVAPEANSEARLDAFGIEARPAVADRPAAGRTGAR